MESTQGFVLWFTGLSGSGKTTLAVEIEKRLQGMNLRVERLDGDILRENIAKDLGFSKEDRVTNIERTAFIAKLLSRNGIATLVSLISPYRDPREKARNEIGNFFEIYVKCPLDVCIERDVKGLYMKAMNNQIPNFTGISDIYEEPENPDLIVETHTQTVDLAVDKIVGFLHSKGFIE